MQAAQVRFWPKTIRMKAAGKFRSPSVWLGWSLNFRIKRKDEALMACRPLLEMRLQNMGCLGALDEEWQHEKTKGPLLVGLRLGYLIQFREQLPLKPVVIWPKPFPELPVRKGVALT